MIPKEVEDEIMTKAIDDMMFKWTPRVRYNSAIIQIPFEGKVVSARSVPESRQLEDGDALKDIAR